MVNQIKFAFSTHFSENARLFFGPTINIGESTKKDGRNEMGKPIEPYWNSSLVTINENKKTTVRGWLGFSAGINF